MTSGPTTGVPSPALGTFKWVFVLPVVLGGAAAATFVAYKVINWIGCSFPSSGLSTIPTPDSHHEDPTTKRDHHRQQTAAV